MENYVNGRIFCRLHLNVRLNFPALCSQASRVKKTARGVSDSTLEAALALYNDSRPFSAAPATTQPGKLSAGIFADSSSNQLSVPINRGANWA